MAVRNTAAEVSALQNSGSFWEKSVLGAYEISEADQMGFFLLEMSMTWGLVRNAESQALVLTH